MRQSLGELICMLGIAAIVGAVLAVVIGMPRWTFDETGAAWVQAVGALITLWFSLWLARRDHVARRSSEKIQARSAALMVLPHFRNAQKRLGHAIAQIDAGHRPEEVDYKGPDYEDPVAFWETRVMYPKFLTQRATLALLGPAAEAAQDAFHKLHSLALCFHEFQIKNVENQLDRRQWYYTEVEWKEIFPRAQAANDLTLRAIKALEFLFE